MVWIWGKTVNFIWLWFWIRVSNPYSYPNPTRIYCVCVYIYLIYNIILFNLPNPHYTNSLCMHQTLYYIYYAPNIMHGAYQQPHQFNTLIVILNQINSLNHFIYQLSNITSLSDSSLFKSPTVKKLVHVIMNNFKYIVSFL